MTRHSHSSNANCLFENFLVGVPVCNFVLYRMGFYLVISQFPIFYYAKISSRYISYRFISKI